MQQQIQELLEEKVELMKQGQVVEAAERFFADDAETFDFTGSVTRSKGELMEKMKGFTGLIKSVNGITHHGSAVSGDTSFVEFTFDFDMTDGSRILWHEVIRSVWKDGRIVTEQYFKN